MSNKNVILCDAQSLSKDLSGKVYIVTGANSGVGFETTQQLVKQGAHVVMACRRTEAAEEVAQGFKEFKGSYEIIRCDLANLQSVRDFVSIFLSKHDRLDGLACNAGMVNMDSTPKYTKDGFELTMATSFYGHFLMTELLLDILKKTDASRMLILSSVVHAGSPKNRYRIHFDDLDWKTRKYDNQAAYSEAKVASVLYAKELAERLKDDGVSTFSVHPGWARSSFGGGGSTTIKALMAISKPILKTLNISDSSWESAQTSLHCLLSDEALNHSGAYYSQHSVLYRDKECKKGGWPMKTPNPHADDMEDAKRLVEVTREKVGLR